MYNIYRDFSQHENLRQSQFAKEESSGFDGGRKIGQLPMVPATLCGIEGTDHKAHKVWSRPIGNNNQSRPFFRMTRYIIGKHFFDKPARHSSCTIYRFLPTVCSKRNAHFRVECNSDNVQPISTKLCHTCPCANQEGLVFLLLL